MSPPQSFDFLIAGGGTVGCVLAARLSHAGHTVALFEAGPEDYSEQVMSPLAAPTLHRSPLEYNFTSTKQPNLAGRQVPNYGGRLLGGSSAVNYANWTRCHSADYDAWAALVGDMRWSYAGLLKYFKKTEHHHDQSGSPEVHGFDGPIHTTAGTRKYPLREPLGTALSEAGLRSNADANGGCPFGYALLTENWRNGKRQPAGKIYDLSKTTVFTDAVVTNIIIDKERKLATGLHLLDGRTFAAGKEVLVCCGSFKTPQLLMLSGIGPLEHLTSHGIRGIVDLPVGQNLHDHLTATMYWKLRNPERGLAIGHPDFMKPEFMEGNPIDWIVTSSIGDDSKGSRSNGTLSTDPPTSEARGHVEFFISYAPIAAPYFFNHSLAGTHISSPILGLLPTSRGSVTLASADPTADPVIDPTYMNTEKDRQAMRTGVRLLLRTMLDTNAGRAIVEEETPPPDLPPLSSSSTDEEIDRRLAAIGMSFYQGGGTAAMGSVVDTELRVKGVKGLRVVDASILPLPLAGHYQCKINIMSRHPRGCYDVAN